MLQSYSLPWQSSARSLNAFPDVGHSSYAITYATVPKDNNNIKSMWLCALFFKDGLDTKNNLPNKEDTDALNAWCNQDDYTFFPADGA